MNEILTKEDLETRRTAAEILAWVESAFARFAADKKIAAAAREGKHLFKELAEESFPIALFAHRYFQASPDVLITQVIGNQKHDAVVDDRRTAPSAIRFIEATVSDMSYEESLRMEILNKERGAPAYGKVRAEGAKGNRKVLEADRTALNRDKLVDDHLSKVIAAVERKSKNKYPDGTALVVRVDDAGIFREDNDVSDLDELAQYRLVPMVADREFRALAFEGGRGVHLVYEL